MKDNIPGRGKIPGDAVLLSTTIYSAIRGKIQKDEILKFELSLLANENHNFLY
jgi:hypothetical protein